MYLRMKGAVEPGGDMRPMAGNQEAMQDLKAILAGRAAFYANAEFRLDTSAAPMSE